jgi:hypothetical protein
MAAHDKKQGAQPMKTCLYCNAALADLGRYCSGCYGRVFHEDESPLVLVNPADPWNEFNLEADRAMADDKLHAVLAPRMLAARVLPIKVRLRELRPNKLIFRIKYGGILMELEKSPVPVTVSVTLERHALELVYRYREVEQKWLDAEDGSLESIAMWAEVELVRTKLAIWLNQAVARAEDAAKA